MSSVQGWFQDFSQGWGRDFWVQKIQEIGTKIQKIGTKTLHAMRVFIAR